MNDINPDNGDENKDEQDFHEYKTPEERIVPLISPIAAAFIGLFGGFFLYQVVGGSLTLLIFGLDIDKTPVDGVRLMTSAGQILFILLPALVFAKWFYIDVGTIIRFRMPDWKGVMLFVAGIIILTPLLQSFIAIQNYFFYKLAADYQFINSIKIAIDQLNEMVEKTYGVLLSVNSFIEGIFVVAVIAVIPAVCEEVMFRGFIQKSFELKIKPVWAILITSVFFGIYHFNPYAVFPLIGIGIYLGFAAYISNSILVPVILHFLNNFIAVMLYITLGNEELIKSTSEQDIDIQSAAVLFFVLILMFSLLIIVIKKYYQKMNRREYAILP
jgi:membrane protease YdiL (CAAX protease family)